VLQIKKWLEALGRQTSGTKAELIVHLQASPETRGDSPLNNGSAAEEVEVLDGAAAWPRQREPRAVIAIRIPGEPRSGSAIVGGCRESHSKKASGRDRGKHGCAAEYPSGYRRREQEQVCSCQINDVIENNSNGNHGNVNICANSTDANVNSTRMDDDLFGVHNK